MRPNQRFANARTLSSLLSLAPHFSISFLSSTQHGTVRQRAAHQDPPLPKLPHHSIYSSHTPPCTHPLCANYSTGSCAWVGSLRCTYYCDCCAKFGLNFAKIDKIPKSAWVPHVHLRTASTYSSSIHAIIMYSSSGGDIPAGVRMPTQHLQTELAWKNTLLQKFIDCTQRGDWIGLQRMCAPYYGQSIATMALPPVASSRYAAGVEVPSRPPADANTPVVAWQGHAHPHKPVGKLPTGTFSDLAT